MKIKSVEVDNRRKRINIMTAKGAYSLPFVKLSKIPTVEDKIIEVYVDKELGKEAVTYLTESGYEDSIHLDVFLDFNKEPDFLKKIFLFKLTDKAREALDASKLSKNEVCRRLKTSPSQLARLLDSTNDKKSVDKMLELLAVLGVSVEPEFDVA
ncbi:MAG: hypothetical protein KDD45_01400 [Bdellovibrionales bacterium]|nr:hypothetical protein [Bdellovibrionales bacterium]